MGPGHGMAKGEISWKGTFEDGRKRQVYAKKVGDAWRKLRVLNR